MITCPACGTQNPEDGKFCIACGVDLKATAAEERVRTDSVDSPPEPPPPPRPDVPPPYLYESAPPPPQPPPPPRAPDSPPAPTYAAPRAQPAKDRALALIIEVGAGLVGFLGIGWMYAGNVNVGLVWLLGFWVGNIIAFILDFVTIGLFTCIHVPLAIAALPVSAVLLYNYTKQHPEAFGP